MMMEGKTIVMRNWPPPAAFRAFFGVFGLLFSGYALVSIFNMAQTILGFADVSPSAMGWGFGLLITALFAGFGAMGFYVALLPKKELRFDPDARQAMLIVRGLFGARSKAFDFATLEPPEVSFVPEAGDNSARYVVAITLPSGVRMEYNEPPLALEDQKRFAETWQGRIARMIA